MQHVLKRGDRKGTFIFAKVRFQNYSTIYRLVRWSGGGIKTKERRGAGSLDTTSLREELLAAL